MKPLVIIVDKKDKDNVVLTVDRLNEIIEQAYDQGYAEGYAIGSKNSLTLPASPSCPNTPFYPGVVWGTDSSGNQIRYVDQKDIHTVSDALDLGNKGIFKPEPMAK